MRNKNLIGDNEILHVIDEISHLKGLSKNSLFSSIEKALTLTAKKKYGLDIAIKSYINRDNGNILFYREFLVSDLKKPYENCNTISQTNTYKISLNLKEGSIYKELLPPLKIARHNAISVRNILIKLIKELERKKLLEEYKFKVGTIITGIITKTSTMGVTVKINRNTEATLKVDQMLKSDTYKPNDKIKALLLNLSNDSNGVAINLSRTNSQFVLKLFEQIVPEIEDKIIEIKSIAREPYSRTKIAVHSNNSSIDAVGACIGIRGSRVKSVTSELREEKIDIIAWNDDPAKLIVNALGDVIKVFINKVSREIEVIVPDDKLSQSIGRKGQNIKLISELIGWKINIRSETYETARRKDEFKRSSDILINTLDVELLLAEILISEGFDSINKIANSSTKDIAKIQGVSEKLSKELISRANNYKNNNKI